MEGKNRSLHIGCKKVWIKTLHTDCDMKKWIKEKVRTGQLDGFG